MLEIKIQGFEIAVVLLGWFDLMYVDYRSVQKNNRQRALKGQILCSRYQSSEYLNRRNKSTKFNRNDGQDTSDMDTKNTDWLELHCILKIRNM